MLQDIKIFVTKLSININENINGTVLNPAAYLIAIKNSIPFVAFTCT